jgi:hypothetical protein
MDAFTKQILLIKAQQNVVNIKKMAEQRLPFSYFCYTPNAP